MKTVVSIAIEQIDASLGSINDQVAAAAKSGVDGVWLTQLPSQRDAPTLLAGLTGVTREMTVGTAVLPVYSRLPVVMAQTALTLDELMGGRLVLGLGRGHRMFGEWMLGARYPATTGPMREYLTIVTSLIRNGEVDVTGQWFQGHALYAAPRRPDLPVFIGSFGPRMLALAAELADGVILWLCTPGYVREVVLPSLRRGWQARTGSDGAFTVVAIIPAMVTDQPERYRDVVRRVIAVYAHMENYQRLLAASGFGDAGTGRVSDAMIDQLAAVGSAEHVRAQIAAYRDAGVTNIAVAPLEAPAADPDGYAATIEAVLGA